MNISKIASDEKIAMAKLSSDAQLSQYEIDRKHEQKLSEISANNETKKQVADMASKPNTTIQLDANEIMGQAATAIEQMGQEMAKNNQSNNEILTQLLQTMIEISKAPREISLDNGRKATVQSRHQ